MDISYVIALAKKAELKQLGIAEDDDAILGYLNLGVLEIHKRLPLIQSKAVITIAAGKLSYSLDGTDTDVVIDLTRNDLLMVNEIYDTEYENLPINDKQDASSVRMAEYNVIEFPADTLEVASTLTVAYRAAPKAATDAATGTVPLPPQFLEALLHYIGYRAHGSLKGDTKFENNAHYIRFEKSMKTIESRGLFSEEELSSAKFDDRGFV